MMHEAITIIDDIFIAAILIIFTSLIHAVGLDFIMREVGRQVHKAQGHTLRHHLQKIGLSVLAIMGIFLLITVHIWLWAFVYRGLNVQEFQTLEDAVYFSTTTFTTLGYGDIVLKDNWRVLSGIEAANGIVLLGWSTAFLFEIMTMLYPRKRV